MHKPAIYKGRFGEWTEHCDLIGIPFRDTIVILIRLGHAQIQLAVAKLYIVQASTIHRGVGQGREKIGQSVIFS